MAAPMKLSGNSSLTRWHSSLLMAAQVALVCALPMWWAMKLARGEKIVRSMPRSCILPSWFVIMLSRSSSSLMCSSPADGVEPSARPAIWRLRHASSAGGAVV